MRFPLLLAFLLLPPVLGHAGHNPLLPRPQEIRYSSGQLRIQGLRIHFASKPTAEDRFAADELASILGTRAKAPIPVVSGPASGRAIVLRRTGSGPALAGLKENPGPDSREAYTLKVDPKGIEIRASSSAGLFYGVQTLRQLIEGSGAGAVIPEVELRDWPALAYRAVMMDMSHGALPTEEEVMRQIDFIARWKANQYYFYSEASIELNGYPLLNPGGRFRQEQVHRIVAYARHRHVDVVPCLEFYGHLHDLFRIEHYADLAVLPHGQDFNPRDPRVVVLLSEWVNQLGGLFPSPYMHIGFDEPYELEKAAQRAGGATQGELYLQHLIQVTRLVKQLGKHVVIWGDMHVLNSNTEIMAALPSGITAVPWHNGLEKDYDAYLAPLAARGVSEYASTSVYGYYQIFPDFNQTFAALDNLVRDARKYGAMGLLLTLWTDDAQNLTRMSFPGVAYGMAGAWQSTAMVPGEFFSDYAHQTSPAGAATELAKALQACADAETRLQTALGQYSMLKFWADPLAPVNLECAQAHREDFHQARLLAEDAQVHLQRALDLGGDPASLSLFLLGARMLDYAGMRYIYAAEMSDFWKRMGTQPGRRDVTFYFENEISDAAHSRIADLIDTITNLRESYRTAWLAEYTPYRLRAALGKWDAESEYWWKLQRRFQILLETFRDGDTLPPLESFGSSAIK